MCQLTYCNLQNRELNRLMVYLLSVSGSKFKHRDGCGFICSDNSIWKTEKAAHIITNLGNIINSYVVDNRAVPFHIRYATLGIAVNKENSHPFAGKHYILMHNGSLNPRNEIEEKAPKDKDVDSDSLRFLNSLDGVRDENPKLSFQDIFNKAMDNYMGKFAFIIREKATGDDYIIRGVTAELWISHLKVDGIDVGYVVNTLNDTIRDAAFTFCNIMALKTGKNYEFTIPVLLKQDTIFIARKTDVADIAPTREYFPPKKEIVPIVKTRSDSFAGGTDWTSRTSKKVAQPLSQLMDISQRVYQYLESHSMSLLDFQIMFQVSSKVSLLELSKEDVEAFLNHVMPKISAPNKLRQSVKSILNGDHFPIDIYVKYGLEYPWPVNSQERVLEVLKDYVNKK